MTLTEFQHEMRQASALCWKEKGVLLERMAAPVVFSGDLVTVDMPVREELVGCTPTRSGVTVRRGFPHSLFEGICLVAPSREVLADHSPALAWLSQVPHNTGAIVLTEGLGWKWWAPTEGPTTSAQWCDWLHTTPDQLPHFLTLGSAQSRVQQLTMRSFTDPLVGPSSLNRAQASVAAFNILPLLRELSWEHIALDEKGVHEWMRSGQAIPVKFSRSKSSNKLWEIDSGGVEIEPYYLYLNGELHTNFKSGFSASSGFVASKKLRRNFIVGETKGYVIPRRTTSPAHLANLTFRHFVPTMRTRTIPLDLMGTGGVLGKH